MQVRYVFYPSLYRFVGFVATSQGYFSDGDLLCGSLFAHGSKLEVEHGRIALLFVRTKRKKKKKKEKVKSFDFIGLLGLLCLTWATQYTTQLPERVRQWNVK